MAITSPDAVPGELITAAWGDAVRADLTALDTGKLAKAGDTATATVYVGSAASGANGTGLSLRDDGIIVSRLNDPSGLSTASMAVQRAGLTSGVGGKYIVFSRGTTSGGAVVESGSVAITTGGATAFNTSSDRRIKTVRGDVTDGLQIVTVLRPVRFVFNDDETQTELSGFLADEVAEVVPEAVTGEADAVTETGEIAPQQLDRSALIPVLVAAVAELAARVAALEAG